MVVGVLLVAAAGAVGCRGGGDAAGGGQAAGADAHYTTLYNRGEYRAAYRAASSASRRGSTADRAEAAYVAGLAAERIGDPAVAVRYLRRAAETGPADLAADANASLGLALHRLGRYDESARRLYAAAEHLSGEDRARAYFHAGLSLQKLNRWPQARTALLLARDGTRDAAFRGQVERQLAVTGYTVQLGAFADVANARRQAEAIAARARAARLGAPRLVTADEAGRTLTLVHVGRFTSYAAAQQAREALGDEAIVVPLAGRP